MKTPGEYNAAAAELFTQTDYDAERWTALMLLWGLGEVTLTTDDAGMFVVDFDSAESADRSWKGKDSEECLAAVIESFTSEHWDFDALPKAKAAGAPEQEPVAHSDHPMRHWDRTCPACIADLTPAEITEMQKTYAGQDI